MYELVYVYYALVFAAGTFFGSFLNVVADRLINGEPIFIGRSHCTSCNKPLGFFNLIPIFSFLFQKGKCSNCKVTLSYYYPISELLTGAAFVLAFYLSKVFLGPITFLGLLGLVFIIFIFCIYIILFLTDAKYQLIPDFIANTGIIASFVFLIFTQVLGLILLRKQLLADEFGQYLIKVGYMTSQIAGSAKYIGLVLISTVGIALFFWLLVVLTKERGMGKGDINLGVLIGLFNGFPTNILAVFLGFVFGAVISLILIIFGKKTMKDTVAFGPFLIGGSLVAVLFGSQILGWYLKLL